MRVSWRVRSIPQPRRQTKTIAVTGSLFSLCTSEGGDERVAAACETESLDTRGRILEPPIRAHNSSSASWLTPTTSCCSGCRSTYHAPSFSRCRGYGTCRRRAGCPRKAPRVSVPRTVSFLLSVSLSALAFSSHADRHRQVHGFHMLSTVLQRLPRPARDLSGPVLGSCLHLLHVVRFAFFFFCRPVHLPSVRSQTDSWYCMCMSKKKKNTRRGHADGTCIPSTPKAV